MDIKSLNEGDALKALADGAKLINVISEADYENFFIKENYVIPFIPESMHHLLKVIPSHKPIILGREEDANMVAQKLNELGFEQIVGYTNFDLHKFILEQPDLDLIMNIEEEEFGIDAKHQEDIAIIDLRDMEECQLGYVENALNIPIDILKEKIEPLRNVKQIYLYCSDGFRSMLAACILKQNNIHHFKNLLTGFTDFTPKHVNIKKPTKK